MAAVLRIPTVLRPALGGATTMNVEGDTIGDVLAKLSANYPAVKSQLLNPDGTLHRFLNVYINDDDVRYLGGVDAPVKNDDEITLLPAVAGGCDE
jgi:molybdopterin converting factor small subunit